MSKKQADYKQWLMFWTVNTVFTILEMFGDAFVSWYVATYETDCAGHVPLPAQSLHRSVVPSANEPVVCVLTLPRVAPTIAGCRCTMKQKLLH